MSLCVHPELRQICCSGRNRGLVPLIAVDQTKEIIGIAAVIAEPRQHVQDIVLATERDQIDLAEGGSVPPANFPSQI